MKNLAFLAIVLCLGVSLSHADILRTESGEVHNGQLTSYDSKGFLFEVKQAKGIYLGKVFPKEDVAKIVMSSSEDFLYREYQKMAADEVLKDTTVEVVANPVDKLVLTSGVTETGRMKGYEQGTVRFDLSSSTEELNIKTIPLLEIKSVVLSNAEFTLSEKLQDLTRTLKARKVALEKLAEEEADRKKGKQLRRALAESVAKEPEGSIYDDLDYEKYLKGNTFEVSPEDVLSETAYQSVPNTGTIIPSYQGPSRDIEGMDRIDSIQDYSPRQNRDRDEIQEKEYRPLRRVPLRQKRDESKKPRIDYPFIQSVDVIGTGENQIVIYNRKNPARDK